jgi:hypothetical protein
MKKFSTLIVILVFVAALWLLIYEQEKAAIAPPSTIDEPTTTNDKEAQQKIFKQQVGQNVKVAPLPESAADLTFPAFLILKSGQEMMVYKGGDIIKLFNQDGKGTVVFRGGIDMGAEGPQAGEYNLSYETLKAKADLLKKV